NKETDLPADRRWPTYHSLTGPADTDGDGIPNYWEAQFGLDKNDSSDGKKVAHGGYTNLEHYLNNTHPQGGSKPIVFISGAVTRANSRTPGALKVSRTGSTKEAITVRYLVYGTAKPGMDYKPLPIATTIPAGQASAFIPVEVLPGAREHE